MIYIYNLMTMKWPSTRWYAINKLLTHLSCHSCASLVSAVIMFARS